jgi:hypothetical protein
MPVELSSWLVAWRNEIHEQHPNQWSTPLPFDVAEEMLADGHGRLIVGVHVGRNAQTCVVLPVAFYKLVRAEQIHPWGYMGLAGLGSVPSRLFPPHAHVLSKMQKNPVLDPVAARALRGFGAREIVGHVCRRVARDDGRELWIDFEHGDRALTKLYANAGFRRRKTVRASNQLGHAGFDVWSCSAEDRDDGASSIEYVEGAIAARYIELVTTQQVLEAEADLREMPSGWLSRRAPLG